MALSNSVFIRLLHQLSFQTPPIRLLLLGPRGAGKTLHGRNLAKKLGLFHISFKDRLQELIMHKTKKKIGPEHEEDNEEEPPEEWVVLYVIKASLF